MDKKAVRNLRLCTKDCLCLYVCPFGATDTENSVIDVEKCNGCGVCAQACPSGAISMVPVEYPPQQYKTDEIKAVLNELAQNKSDGEMMARQISRETDKDGLARLMSAVAKSERLIAEDIVREAGFMLPQSNNTHVLLERFAKNPPTSDFPMDAVKKLLEIVPSNETNVKPEKVEEKNNEEEELIYIFEQLKANLTGECSEAGIYLCMARVAHREGYPEVGLYFEKAAYEEAEHAAKFMDLLKSHCE